MLGNFYRGSITLFKDYFPVENSSSKLKTRDICDISLYSVKIWMAWRLFKDYELCVYCLHLKCLPCFNILLNPFSLWSTNFFVYISCCLLVKTFSMAWYIFWFPIFVISCHSFSFEPCVPDLCRNIIFIVEFKFTCIYAVLI